MLIEGPLFAFHDLYALQFEWLRNEQPIATNGVFTITAN
jgi:hypothetical protein